MADEVIAEYVVPCGHKRGVYWLIACISPEVKGVFHRLGLI